ncbi:hypothetical protein ACIHFE_29685 [Streptomyces sp. NPDC052396]|uniref:hypothetical protein n=1 Tax=Streptomyces sp. NPDC052396 TaxID=3365689 RepID=UPI0037D150A7
MGLVTAAAREGTALDVSAELATIGATGASALVASMTTDGWHGVRDWIAGLLGRGRTEVEARQAARLDRDRELLLAAPEAEDRSRDVMDSWAVRLQDLADDDPEAARELLKFVAQWQAENPEAAQKATVIRQHAKASGKARINQVGGNQTVIKPRRP